MLGLLAGCGTKAQPPATPSAASFVKVEQVAGLPSAERAYLGQHIYLVARHPPYTLSVGTLMGKDMRPLTTLVCTLPPAVSFVFSGHLVLLCPGTASLSGILINAITGQQTRLWTWKGRMNGPSELTAWTGHALYWAAFPNVMTSTLVTGGLNLITGARMALPATLRGGVLFGDNQVGDGLYVMSGELPSVATLWHWADGQGIKMGTLTNPRVLAVGSGGTALAVTPRLGGTAVGSTVYLERAGSGVSRQWYISGDLLTAGMVYFVV